MALSIVHALRRSNRIHFLDCTASMAHSVQYTKLTASCRPRSQTRFVHLLRHSRSSQVPRNPSFCFMSPISLKMESDLCLWNRGQVRVNFASKPHEEKPVNFMDSDKCIVLDSDNAHLSDFSFLEARQLADKKKCRLVYLHTNKDGVFYFKLQSFVNAMDNLMLDSTPKNSQQYVPLEKPEKSQVKEFKIQSSISDHDFSTKLKKMRALLDKGKQLMVLIRTPENSSKVNTTAGLIKKLTEDLQDICNIKQDLSKNITRLSLMPKEKVEH